MTFLPTSGRTIHWQYAKNESHPEGHVLFVTSLDYGRNIERATIYGRDVDRQYRSFGEFALLSLPADLIDWHYTEDCGTLTDVSHLPH